MDSEQEPLLTKTVIEAVARRGHQESTDRCQHLQYITSYPYFMEKVYVAISYLILITLDLEVVNVSLDMLIRGLFIAFSPKLYFMCIL